jgi:hypothetical protein
MSLFRNELSSPLTGRRCASKRLVALATHELVRHVYGHTTAPIGSLGGTLLETMAHASGAMSQSDLAQVVVTFPPSFRACPPKEGPARRWWSHLGEARRSSCTAHRGARRVRGCFPVPPAAHAQNLSASKSAQVQLPPDKERGGNELATFGVCQGGEGLLRARKHVDTGESSCPSVSPLS